ncbi:MAG TPA: glycoside hydrolase family 3 N-terminal domain-containing protein, partial [Candidatus Polarisedimenticolia bacterium]|nr:glycoside hydrolase family 3 N-terminal domain-containing protein [Candidatus Polarisedimenticolia bacterium]
MSQPTIAQSGGWNLGDLLFVGFDGTALNAGLESFFREVRPGGFILFKRNITDPEQLLRLVSHLKSLTTPPPLIAVDEEGGQVSRLRSFAPTLPPAAKLAQFSGTRPIREAAAALGRMLASAGFDLDFAPVVDLCAPGAANGIGDRSFGIDPVRTAELAGAYLDGLADAGILGCLKHFPGLGPTVADSHQQLPTIQKNAEAFL